MSMRTLTEILKDADKAETLKELDDLRLEFVKIIYEYPAAAVSYAQEHIEGLVKEMAKKDARLLINFLEHNNIFESPKFASGTERVLNVTNVGRNQILAEKIKRMNLKPTFWQRLKKAWNILIGK